MDLETVVDWLRGRARRDRDAEAAREIQDPLDLEVEEFRAAGLSREGSENAARRYFGNTTLVREEIHAVWTFDRVRTIRA